YRIEFHVGDYFRRAGAVLADPPFSTLSRCRSSSLSVRSIITCRSCARPGPTPPIAEAEVGALRGHALRLDAVSQRFGDFVAVKDVNLDVAPGELVALLGPSGCGKSTLLRIISGFIHQSEGSVLFDGQPVDHLSPRHRGVGIVFQNYALFPHMNVAEN